MVKKKRLPSRAIGRERQVMVVTALVAVTQFIAAYHAVTMPPELAARVSLIPALEFIAAVIWGLIMSLATWRVAWYKTRSLRTGVYALIAFVVYSVARLFVFTRADYDVNRLPFLLAATIFLLFAAVVYLMRPVVRRGQATEIEYDRKSEN